MRHLLALGCLLALLRSSLCCSQASADDCQSDLNYDDQVSLLQTYVKVSKANGTQLPQRPQSQNLNATGVKLNGEGDLSAFLATFFTDTFGFVFMVVVFTIFSKYFPIMYQNNVGVFAPREVPEGTFGWIQASLATSIDEVADKVGLDHAMLLEFTNLCMRICVIIGVPMMFILGPVHFTFGGHHIWQTHDNLSAFSFGNLENNVRLYWLHPIAVWGVVFAVQVQIYRAQSEFLLRRYKWLRNLPEPRSTTLLVEGIPDEYQSNTKLQQFFTDLFPKGQIKSAYVVKKTDELVAMIEEQTSLSRDLGVYMSQWDEAGKSPDARPQVYGQDAITYYEKLVKVKQDEIAKERGRINADAASVGGVNSSCGFVTFVSRMDKELAQQTVFSKDRFEWEVSMPPSPESVIWSDLAADTTSRSAWTILGYLLVAGLYLAYLPIVIAISNIATHIVLPGPKMLNTVWKGVAPTVGLIFMVSFLPTFLLLIFRCCFSLQGEVLAQKLLQDWYFVFQVVFVLMITAISGSIWQFMEICAEHPFQIPQYLGETMPFATHFYMNFLMTQWVTHGMNLTRYIQLSKYVALRGFYDQKQAVELAEPEDQDYYGMGSRSARFATNMCIGIIYGTLSPPMSWLCFVNFAICRVVYGYLIPFAETKKGDLGGAFWVSSLNHLFVANIIYVFVMTGVLYGRHSSSGPSLLAAASLFYVIWSWRRFQTQFQWEHLPFPELKMACSKESMQKSGESGAYIQEELLPDPQRTKSVATSFWNK